LGKAIEEERYGEIALNCLFQCVLFYGYFRRLNVTALMQSYPARALDRRPQVEWAKDAREGPRVLMSLRVDFGPMG